MLTCSTLVSFYHQTNLLSCSRDTGLSPRLLVTDSHLGNCVSWNLMGIRVTEYLVSYRETRNHLPQVEQVFWPKKCQSSVLSSTSSALPQFSLKNVLSACCSVCTCGGVCCMHTPVWGHTFIFKFWKIQRGASPHCPHGYYVQFSFKTLKIQSSPTVHSKVNTLWIQNLMFAFFSELKNWMLSVLYLTGCLFMWQVVALQSWSCTLLWPTWWRTSRWNTRRTPPWTILKIFFRLFRSGK